MIVAKRQKTIRGDLMAGTSAGIKGKIEGLVNNVRYYWNEPPKASI